MSRGNWCTVLAAFGCLILTANHAGPKGNSAEAAESSVAASLQYIADRQGDAAKRAESAEQEEQPCGPNQYDSRADLCAQWKAADAAADSAWWAWVSGLVGFGSLVGVVAALGLALHSNWIARDTARRQLRAYISVEPGGILQGNGDESGYQSVLLAKNCGQTPAYKLRCSAAVIITADPFNFDCSEHVGMLPRDIREQVLGPGEKRYAYGGIAPVDEASQIAIAQRKAAMVLFGIATYEDCFGSEHYSRFAFIHWGEELSAENSMRCRKWNDAT